MALNILRLKGDLTGVVHGTTLNSIVNLDGVILRAGNQLLEDVDPQETKRYSQVTLYDGIYDYTCPVDLKGNTVADIAPQVARMPNSAVTQLYNQSFDSSKDFTLLDTMTVKFNQGVKSLRINGQGLPAGVILNDATSITTNGTWSVGGGASNLRVDNINYVTGNASLAFDLAAVSTTGYLENSTMTAQNLSTVASQAVVFLSTYLPTGSAFTNVNIRFGSSAANYYSVNATLNQLGVAFNNGWNLISLPWASATTVGTPNSAAINYIRITWTYNGTAQTAVRLNDIESKLGLIRNIEYYSKYLYRDATTGLFQETVTDNSNLINLDSETYGLLFNKVGFYVAQQLQGLDAMFYDANFFANEYAQALGKYKSRYKSEIVKPKSTYYSTPKPGFSKYVNGRKP